MRLILMVVIYFWICFKQSVAEYKFTYDMALHCKEHICQHGYNYDTYFVVDAEERRRLKTDPDVAFEMHIAILAASNGHILLSTVAHPTANDPVYEIVIGGGNNMFTQIRRNLRSNAKASTKSVNLLSPIEFRAFYIKISTEGLVEVGKEGDPLPFLSYTDIDPLPIKYFSFSSWSGVEAKFLYDCPAPKDNNTDGLTPDSKMVENKESNSLSLRRTLLMGRMPQLPPAEKMNVKLGIIVTSVSYNAFESKLTTGLSVFMSWVDNSMAWNPTKFNETTRLTFRQGQIWKPTFMIFNSDDQGMLDAKNPDLIWMVNSGEAVFHFQTTIDTWCFHYSNSFNKWPRDEYKCSIVIQPWESHETILLTIPKKEETEGFTDIDEIIQNVWDVHTEQYVISAGAWDKAHRNANKIKSDRLIIKLDISRRASSYNIVFYTPWFVLAMFVLMSFWANSLKMDRVWFYAGCVIVISMGLCYIDYLIPCHTIPTILILYTVVLGCVLIALIVQVLLMTSTADDLCKKPFVKSILIQSWLRTCFCLPKIKICRIYETLGERSLLGEGGADSGVDIPHLSSNVEEMQSENDEYDERCEVAEVLDKIMFFFYSTLFAVMLVLHF